MTSMRSVDGSAIASVLLLGLAACGGNQRGAQATAAPASLDEGTSSAAERVQPGNRVFAEGQPLVVHLTIADDDVRELEEHGNRERYVVASARLEGSSFQAVELERLGVRRKGSYTLLHCFDEATGARSRAGDCAKLSYKLKFDEYQPGARFDGLTRLNLHAASGDETKLRELLGYRVFRDFGVDAPRAVPAQLYVNGALAGLFIAVEEVDGRYTEGHFPGAGDGNLYKEIWPNPLFSDEELRAALRTNEERGDVSDMRAFATAVGATRAESFADDLAPFVDIDRLLRYLAVDRAVRNWDGVTAFYSARSPHNFYWYKDNSPGGRFHLIPWDFDDVLWPFHPYFEPREFVTAPALPDLNERPRDCSLRVIWEATGEQHMLPPRCDKLLTLLIETRWPRLVELGRELLQGPLAAEHLERLAGELAQRLEPLVATDPTLELDRWKRSLRELSGILRDLGPSFEAFLAEGLTEERPAQALDVPPPSAAVDAVSIDGGLIVGGPTNFEFAAAPPGTPDGVFVFADPVASVFAPWNTEAPLSGRADLRFDFSFRRGAEPYDEWAGIGIENPASDVSAYSQIVVWMSAAALARSACASTARLTTSCSAACCASSAWTTR